MPLNLSWQKNEGNEKSVPENADLAMTSDTAENNKETDSAEENPVDARRAESLMEPTIVIQSAYRGLSEREKIQAEKNVISSPPEEENPVEDYEHDHGLPGDVEVEGDVEVLSDDQLLSEVVEGGDDDTNLETDNQILSDMVDDDSNTGLEDEPRLAFEDEEGARDDTASRAASAAFELQEEDDLEESQGGVNNLPELRDLEPGTLDS